VEPESFDLEEIARVVGAVPWVSAVHARPETGSTNDDAAALARDGAPEGTVVVADLQRAGRGRLGRSWVAAAGVAVHASWIVRPSVAAEGWPLYSLATAVAAAEAIAAGAGVSVRLKWPNDLMAGGRKLGGILAEVVPGGALVVGLGVNVGQASFEGDLDGVATSLAMERSKPVERAALLASILERFAPHAADPATALPGYRDLCSTLGREVLIERAGAEDLLGLAVEVGERGELVLDGPGGRVVVAAGDVRHLR
jgi:BirA family biotin operon repressor/biotin-[acetyl-CoA-carboxylase] ligase